MSCRTIVKYEDTALPGAAESVTLFNSVTAFPPGRVFHNVGPHYWFTYSILANANATGNSVTGQYSNDSGTTWNEFYASTTNEPIGDGSTYVDEVYVGQYQDVRFLFNNGALAQTSFVVNMALDSDRATSE